MENNKWVLHFHRVVARGNIRMIKALLETKPDDVSVDAIVRNSLLSNRTVLEYFCEEYVKEPKKNTAEIIKLLLSYGANPLQKQVNGNPLLNTLCLATGTNDIVMEFLQYIEDIDTPIFGRYNALLWSLDTGMEDCVKYCLERGADPNLDGGGITPLYYVVFYNEARSKEMIKILLDYGADINIEGIDGYTPLHLALSQSEGKEMCKFILKQEPDLHSINGINGTPLYHYLYQRHLDLEILQDLLDRGSDPNFLDEEKHNSLHIYALYSRHEGTTAVIETLIKHGAYVNHKNFGGNTPLHYAALTNSEEVVKSLLENGADVTMKNNDGCTPFENIMMDPENNGIALVFIKHIMLRIHSGKMQMTDNISAMIESSKTFTEMATKCNSELLNLKEKTLGDTTITLFKVLTSNAVTVSKFAGNEKTAEELARLEVGGYYGAQLKQIICDGLERKRLKVCAERFFSSCAFGGLTYVELRTINAHLTNCDLKKLENVLAYSSYE